MKWKSISEEESLKTILVLALAALLIHVIIKVPYLDGVSIALMLIGIFISPLARIISFLWLKIGEALGFVSSKIILSLLFFVVLVPLAFFYRLFHRDHLQLSKKQHPDDSYYHLRNHEYEKSDLENPW